MSTRREEPGSSSPTIPKIFCHQCGLHILQTELSDHECLEAAEKAAEATEKPIDRPEPKRVTQDERRDTPMRRRSLHAHHR